VSAANLRQHAEELEMVKNVANYRLALGSKGYLLLCAAPLIWLPNTHLSKD
jgi:hypothetical protein